MSRQNSPKNGVDISRKKLSKSDSPFYEPPSGVPTSSQIIKEAKEKLHNAKRNAIAGGYVPESGNLARTLSSNRPFTPREDKRTLFGPKSTRPVNERPPSSFCVGSKSFDSDNQPSSRPLSATRLSPIEKSNSKLNLNTQHSTEDEPKSNIKNEENDILRLTSPKTIISRLAPLEIPKEKKLAINQNQKPKNSKNHTTHNQSLSSNSSSLLSASNIQDDEQTEQNWKNHIEPLLVQLDDHFKTNQIDLFCDTADNLNKQLHTYQIYSKTCSKRTMVLKLIFKYLDTDSDKAKLKIARIILNMKVSGNNLHNICRLIFTISRNTDNDVFFMDNNILGNSISQFFSITVLPCCEMHGLNTKELSYNQYFDWMFRKLTNQKIGYNSTLLMTQVLMRHLAARQYDSIISAPERFDFKENTDTVIYFSGTIKNLSENTRILKQLSLKNIEEIIAKIISDIDKYFKDGEKLKPDAGHVLVQLTVILRNLADLSNTRTKFINLGIIEQLGLILKYYTSDGELMLNVSRILSKLTLHNDCCEKLISYVSCYKSFIKVMIKHDSKQDLIVRIGFVLGNITARHDEARIRFLNEKYSIDTLINTIKIYLNSDIQSARKDLVAINKANNLEDINENEPNPNEDVLIKLIRLIANLAINEEAGERLARREELFDILLKILDVKDLNTCEELIIDTIVTINNLTFYNSDLIFQYSQKLVDGLMKYLLSNNLDAIIEVFRVFANLSRDQSTRGYLVFRKAIAYLLNSNNRELVYIIIGVLINIMADPENRFILKQEKGIKKIIDILNEVGPSDWQLSSMICKLLMNYSEKTKTNLNYSYFEVNELKVLRVILTELLDEKFALRSTQKTEFKSTNEENSQNIDEYMDFLWKQEFHPVATFLLRRIMEEK